MGSSKSITRAIGLVRILSVLAAGLLLITTVYLWRYSHVHGLGGVLYGQSGRPAHVLYDRSSRLAYYVHEGALFIDKKPWIPELFERRGAEKRRLLLAEQAWGPLGFGPGVRLRLPLWIVAMFPAVFLGYYFGCRRWWSWSRHESRRKANRCISCGYDLRGCVGPRCPECGRPVPPGWLLRLHPEIVLDSPHLFPQKRFPVHCKACGTAVDEEGRCRRCGRVNQRGELLVQQYLESSRPVPLCTPTLKKQLHRGMVLYVLVTFSFVLAGTASAVIWAHSSGYDTAQVAWAMIAAKGAAVMSALGILAAASAVTVSLIRQFRFRKRRAGIWAAADCRNRGDSHPAP